MGNFGVGLNFLLAKDNRNDDGHSPPPGAAVGSLCPALLQGVAASTG